MTTSPTTLRAAIYARVSTADQTCDNQLLELHRYVDARGWTAVDYVDRGVSGAKDRRPALDALLKDARRRRFDVLIVWRLDRLGRNLRHLVVTLEDLSALGIGFVSLNEGIDATTPAGRLQMAVLGAINSRGKESRSGCAPVWREPGRRGNGSDDDRTESATQTCCGLPTFQPEKQPPRSESRARFFTGQGCPAILSGRESDSWGLWTGQTAWKGVPQTGVFETHSPCSCESLHDLGIEVVHEYRVAHYGSPLLPERLRRVSPERQPVEACNDEEL